LKRTVFLEDVPVEAARERFDALLAETGWSMPGGTEEVPAAEATGRVTAGPVYAALSSPHYHAAAMDGFAVRAAGTFGAAETSPRRLRVDEDALPVDTGDPLPAGTDAVLMVEDAAAVEPGLIEIIKPCVPWQHVRTMGEDIVATEMILPAGHRIRPVDLGGLLAAGVGSVRVYQRPRVVLIPTGDEVVPPGAPLVPGSVIEFNSRMLGGFLAEWGAEPVYGSIVPDDRERLERALTGVLAGADLVLILAGSSAGREDYTAGLVGKLGRVAVHGVATRPGKPVILGEVAGKPVVGVPGYPGSAALALELFVRPLVYRRQGLWEPPPVRVEASLTRKTVSVLGVDEFIRVKMGRVGDKLVATPLARGAGLVGSLMRADGLLLVPRDREGFPAGQTVAVNLVRTLAEIEETTVIAGSHDIALDLLGSWLRRRFPQATLSSAHVGSLAGLLAVARGEAHLAGTHLLDEESGEYNVGYVRRVLADQKAVLVNLAYREQGLLVAPDNPLGIAGLADLARVRFVNRQRGAGTRVLLDHRLKQLGLDPARIEGYGREEFTHMAVAAAVASGSADAGLGIRAAARALGLDFVPVAEERYDLLAGGGYRETPYIQRVLTVIRDPGFQKDVLALGGYDLRDCGKVMWENCGAGFPEP
jgi:putative molybdopterin biosynthesis protein